MNLIEEFNGAGFALRNGRRPSYLTGNDAPLWRINPWSSSMHLSRWRAAHPGSAPPKSGALMATARLVTLALGLSAAAHSVAAQAGEGDIAIALDEREVRFAGITTTKPDREQLDVELSLPGTVAIPPQQLRIVAAPASGLIESMLIASDEAVKGGEPVAHLRSMEIVEAQRQFLASLSDEALAADRLRRIQMLVEARATPERELRAAETAATNAKAHLDERRQILALMELSPTEIENLQSSRKILPSVTVHAPVGGMVVKRHVSPGARVDAAAPLYTIAKLEPLWVSIQVPASRLPAISVGDAVDLPAYGAKGRIIRVARTIDAQTQSASAIAEIDTNGAAVRPGLATTVTVRLNQGPDPQWSVPAASVVRHRDRSWVFVKAREGFIARPVQVIAESPSRTSIRADLAADDEVADRGIISLLAELALADKN